MTKRNRKKYFKKSKKSRTVYISYNQLINDYGLTATLISRYFPEPEIFESPKHGTKHDVEMWREKDVMKIMLDPALQRRLKQLEEKRQKKNAEEEAKKREITEFLDSFSLSSLMSHVGSMERKYILHIGPTNSGKTYDSIQRLKEARKGIYLGPLRLLALEMYEKLNMDDCPCNLITGEEQELVPGATITASTIEMCDYSTVFDVAVIDEAQMLDDPSRGAHWTRAILLVKAKEIHICMAPPAEKIVVALLNKLGEKYERVYHERLVPLEFKGTIKGIKDIQPGDALIAFSRKNVLNIAAHLESKGIKASVIYGSLPPAARREEVRRFTKKETTCVVATDAIGMGVSMPIKRIVFIETEKYDGSQHRRLLPEEIKQISGRAGRFGIYDHGEVVCIFDKANIQNGMNSPSRNIEYVRIPFPKQALESDFDLKEMLTIWNSLPKDDLSQKEDVSDALILINAIGKNAIYFPKEKLYDLISCPVDTKNDDLVDYWCDCCMAIYKGEDFPKPTFGTKTLEACEMQYKGYDILSQLSRRVGIHINCEKEKEEICKRIDELLKEDKKNYIKKCKVCGKPLPLDSRYQVCDRCYKRNLSGFFDWQ